MIQANVELRICVVKNGLGQIVECRSGEIWQREEVEHMLCNRRDPGRRNLIAGKRRTCERIQHTHALARQVSTAFGPSGNASQAALSGPFAERVGIGEYKRSVFSQRAANATSELIA